MCQSSRPKRCIDHHEPGSLALALDKAHWCTRVVLVGFDGIAPGPEQSMVLRRAWAVVAWKQSVVDTESSLADQSENCEWSTVPLAVLESAYSRPLGGSDSDRKKSKCRGCSGLMEHSVVDMKCCVGLVAEAYYTVAWQCWH